MGWEFLPKKFGANTPAILWLADLDPGELRKLDPQSTVLQPLLDAKSSFDKLNPPMFPIAPGRLSTEEIGSSFSDLFGDKNFKNVATQLKVVEARCKALLADKKAKIDKKLKTLLKTIQAAADDYGSSLNTTALLPHLNALLRDLGEADRLARIARIKPALKSMKDVAAKGHPHLKSAAQALAKWDDGMKEEEKEQIRLAVYQNVYDTARDMSQGVVNIVKGLKAGGSVPGIEDRVVATLPKLGATLAKWGNSTSAAPIVGGLDKKGLAQLIRTVQVQADLHDQIAKTLPTV